MRARAIVRAGIGVDGVDLDAATRLGVRVSNVPDYGTESVAQHALAAALAGTRRLTEANKLVAGGGWGFMDLRPMHLPSEQTAGVLGQGRIGRRVAELLRAVGFGRVIAHDPYVEGPYLDGAVEAVSFDTVVTESDVLSLHVPGGDSPLFDAATLGRLKAGSVLVNTARGSLIDHRALVAALANGAPRVACLDVFSPEPPDVAIFADVLDRLILSPHQAWYTEESQADLRRKAAEEALRLLRGEEPKYPVNQPEAPR
jgi:D-3-phosphoglycerate dehydrogenase